MWYLSNLLTYSDTDTKLFDYPMMGGNYGGEEEGEMFQEEPTQKPSPAAQSSGEDNSDLLTYVFIAYKPPRSNTEKTSIIFAIVLSFHSLCINSLPFSTSKPPICLLSSLPWLILFDWRLIRVIALFPCQPTNDCKFWIVWCYYSKNLLDALTSQSTSCKHWVNLLRGRWEYMNQTFDNLAKSKCTFD